MIDYMTNSLLYKESGHRRQIITFSGSFKDQNITYSMFLKLFGELIRKCWCVVLLACSCTGIPNYHAVFGYGKRRESQAPYGSQRYASQKLLAFRCAFLLFILFNRFGTFLRVRKVDHGWLAFSTSAFHRYPYFRGLLEPQSSSILAVYVRVFEFIWNRQRNGILDFNANQLLCRLNQSERICLSL